MVKKKEDMKRNEILDEVTKIANQKGFFFQTADIYGGRAGFFTYGHLGKKLKSRWEGLWRKQFLGLDDNFHEIQSNNILPEPVFKASGHLKSFNDPLVECKKCGFRFRADQFLEDNDVPNAEGLSIEDMDNKIKEKGLSCPKCKGELGEVRWFNMMFSVPIGFGDERGYLSPETAQGAYLTFKQEFQATREKLPLGLAIVDKAYRNEISPRQMFFRLREFTQAELQIFFDPKEVDKHDKWDEVKDKKLIFKLSKDKKAKEIKCENARKELKLPKFYLYHACKIQEFYLDILKISKEKFRFRELSEEEKAFYNKIHFDIEIDLDTLGGFKEVAGLHYRTDHDLKGHEKESEEKLKVSYEGRKFIPHVLELSFGVDRNVWTLLDVFYGLGKEGSMFKFPSNVAPVQIAIFPLVKKDENLVKKSKEIHNNLKQEFSTFFDTKASIGRRYARQDEIGTLLAVTVDGQTLKDDTVTLRERDSKKQVRVKIGRIKEEFRKIIFNEDYSLFK